jgi:hypothetical protein
MIQDYGIKFYLSTEGYYFQYRPDNNDRNIKRATLYRIGTNEKVDEVETSEGNGG